MIARNHDHDHEPLTRQDVIGLVGDLPEDDPARRRAIPLGRLRDGSYTTPLGWADLPEDVRRPIVCPECNRPMRRSLRGRTAYFAHIDMSTQCTHMESPVHFELKQSLSLNLGQGWVPEKDWSHDGSDFRLDVFNESTGVAIEVVSSGVDRYRRKVDALTAAGLTHLWIFNSAGPGLASLFGSETVSVRMGDTPTVTVRGLFRKNVRDLMEYIGPSRTMAFYEGIVWKAVGIDRWEPVDFADPIARAISTGPNSAVGRLVRDRVLYSSIVEAWRDKRPLSEKDRAILPYAQWYVSRCRLRCQAMPTSWDAENIYRNLLDAVLQAIEGARIVHGGGPVGNGGSDTSRNGSKHNPEEPGEGASVPVGQIARMREIARKADAEASQATPAAVVAIEEKEIAVGGRLTVAPVVTTGTQGIAQEDAERLEKAAKAVAAKAAIPPLKDAPRGEWVADSDGHTRFAGVILSARWHADARRRQEGNPDGVWLDISMAAEPGDRASCWKTIGLERTGVLGALARQCGISLEDLKKSPELAVGREIGCVVWGNRNPASRNSFLFAVVPADDCRPPVTSTVI